MRLLPTVAAALAAALVPSASHAAHSYDSCTGFIKSLPTTLGAQGTWCLDKDLSTSQASGEVVTVAANNVTIDCNGFKIGGLAAGPDTQAAGIATLSRLNTVVRNCSVRGFQVGIWADGGGGHVIEDNRLEGNRRFAVLAESTTALIRRNQVLDSGAAGVTIARAIHVGGTVDVIENTIDGVAPATANTWAAGITTANNLFGVIAGNRIRGLAPNGSGYSMGIYAATAGPMQISGNHLFGAGLENSIGIYCGDNQQLATQNQIVGFDVSIGICTPFDNWDVP